MKKRILLTAPLFAALLLGACASDPPAVSAKVIDCQMTTATKEVQRKDGWNPPAEYDCDETSCLLPGQYQFTIILNNSQSVNRIVQLVGSPTPVKAEPGDTILLDTRVFTGIECPAPDDYPTVDVALLSG